ncbi:MKI67 FHA domain-interacting nucleolar phosphoprotein-like [Pseudomyrmex gracilis]|uniref:MKI67 FHA domain-interacting nucleolar phosphoprotein-like n=1 Tax=Pseudomyrmex gracilis TaxID=219809 RepID=UPI0009952BDA|nr:MKI67 FHA domain-interacting nucleolar phosphoprotein-like [Pseudomyrmex gracilis]
MKAKKISTVSEKSVLKKVAKSKISKSSSAGTNVEKAVKNVKKISKKKGAATKTKEKSVVGKKEKQLTKPTRKEKQLTKPTPKEKQLTKPTPKEKQLTKPTRKEKQLTKPTRKSKRLRKFTGNKGVIYLGHIPHGFYEDQIKDYFKQFGTVTRVRVARSKKTGKSRGYGYIEFLVPEVAKVAAESMNNYLMCNRLLKATYIPPEKQHSRYFCGYSWTEQNCPKLRNRKKENLHKNAPQSVENHEKYVKRSLKKLSALESKLQEKGISLNFQPVDVPET